MQLRNVASLQTSLYTKQQRNTSNRDNIAKHEICNNFTMIYYCCCMLNSVFMINKLEKHVCRNIKCCVTFFTKPKI